MSIKVLSYSSLARWSNTEMEQALSLVPEAMRQRIARYQHAPERQSRLASRLLLRQLLRAYDLPFTLHDVQYTSLHKPYVHPDFDFSIAHTDGLVLCSGITRGKIGIDAEKVRDIDLMDYRDVLSDIEWPLLTDSSPQVNFWDIWTRKEALAKASGKGIVMELDQIDTTNPIVSIEAQQYRWHQVKSVANFAAHLAVSHGVPEAEVPLVARAVTTQELLAAG